MFRIKIKRRIDNMLILTRHTNESIKIGVDGEITVVVLGIKGNQVKIGIDAKKDIPINRMEVYERILAERNKEIEQRQQQQE
jgi:carbon storage regulator